MVILGKALYLLLTIVYMRFFLFVLKKSFDRENSTTIKFATRGHGIFCIYNCDSNPLCLCDFCDRNGCY